MNALEYLIKSEWSMGNGQCPSCEGANESWFPHPCYQTPESVGHKLDCDLAAAILDAGGYPVFIGKSKLIEKYPEGSYRITADTCQGVDINEPMSDSEKGMTEYMKKMSKSVDDEVFKRMTENAK